MLENDTAIFVNRKKENVHLVSGIPVYVVDAIPGLYMPQDVRAQLLRLLCDFSLLSPHFGYRAIDPDRLNHLLENGTDRNDDYVNVCEYTETDGNPWIEGHGLGIIAYMGDKRFKDPRAVIAIYDLSQIEKAPILSPRREHVLDPEFIFKDPTRKLQALKGIVVINGFKHIDIYSDPF